MAYIGFRKLMVGATTSTGYAAPSALGRAVSMTVTPNSAEGTLYGDDVAVEHDEAFTDAEITIGSTYIPVALYATLFGHTVNDGVVTFNASDAAPYIGIGAYAPKKVDGVEKYEAIFLTKVKMSEPEGSYETKGDSITYNTPEISGVAIANDAGVWKITKECDTAADAETWITSQFA